MAYPNDSFASATVLAGASGSITPFHYDGDSDPASSEAGEYVIGAGETLWWRWTAPTSGSVAFTTSGSPDDTGAPSGLDTKLQVFTGGGFGSSAAIADNDDGGFGTVTYTYNSRVLFLAVAGQTYWVQLDMYSSGQNGTVHLSWETVEAGPTRMHVEGYSSLNDNVVLPSTADYESWVVLYGEALPDVDLATITFAGGASASITTYSTTIAEFIAPMVGGYHSGPAVIAGAGGYTKTIDVVVLKPETPGFTRNFAPRTISAYLPWVSGGGTGRGVYMAFGFVHNGVDTAAALAGPEGDLGTRDAYYAARDAYTSDGTSYPSSKTLGQALVFLGWGPSGIGSGFGWGVTPMDPTLAPAAPELVIGERSVGHFDNSTQPIQDVWTGSPRVQLPIAAMAQERAWSSFTAEIYAVPAADLLSSEFSAQPMPYERPLLLPPSWFDEHEALAVVPFGSIGDFGASFATVLLPVPFDDVWQGAADYDIFSVLVVIMRQYHEDAADEGPGLPEVAGTNGWIRVSPHPNDESPTDPGNRPAENISISAPIQEPPYRWWVPDGVIVSSPAGWSVGRVR